jgi:hypothetical protein
MTLARLLILSTLIILLCTGIASADIERSVIENTDGTVTVRIDLADGIIMGITEEIPPGFTFVDTAHPAGQTIIEENRLLFAVIGEEMVTYTLRGSGKPVIRGSTLILTDENTIPKEQSPAPLLGIIGALAGAALIVRRRQI